MLNQKSFLKKSFIWILIFFSLVFIYIIQSFLMPIVLASLFVFLTQPIYDYLIKYFKNCYVTSILTLVVVFLIFVLPATLFFYWSYQQAFDLFVNNKDQLNTFNTLLTPVWQKLAIVLQYFGLDWIETDGTLNFPLVVDYIESKVQVLLKKVFSGGVFLSKNIFNIVFEVGMSVLFAFYFFIDGKRIVKIMVSLIPLQNFQKQRMLENLKDTIQSSIKGVSIIGVIQGVLGAITLWICGFEACIFWGFVIFFLSIIPAVGVFAILIPASLILFLQNYILLGVFALISCLFIGVTDYILRPLIMGKKLQMHSLLVIISTLGGVQVFGIIGFLLGPALVSIVLSLFNFYQEIFQDEFEESSFN